MAVHHELFFLEIGDLIIAVAVSMRVVGCSSGGMRRMGHPAMAVGGDKHGGLVSVESYQRSLLRYCWLPWGALETSDGHYDKSMLNLGPGWEYTAKSILYQ